MRWIRCGTAWNRCCRSASGASGTSIAPDYISMRAIEKEEKAREIAAAFHAALHGLRQLYIAVPSQRGRA